ncbi:ATP-binding protein [Herbiconiux sp.]|uniref:sensor histidine kinase n=1 Tax=Herbiconiux sp. TaxID=1871186 RepID=UPI0025BED374|nr:ATP-binding protein [Herbiconiux sp.]
MPPEPAWIDLTVAQTRRSALVEPPSRRGLFTRLIAAAVLVVLVVVAVGVFVARQLAEREAVHDAARSAQLLGDVIVEPALSDALLDGDAEARAMLDELVRSRVLGDSVVRVKIWDADGRILYSDEPRLIGETFGLDDEERTVLASNGVEAEVSDLGAPENRYETGQGALLEAYHAVTSPSGRAVLFEAYFRYDQVSVRTGELWGAFSLLAVGSVLALLVLLLPLGRRLVVYLRDVRAHREAVLQHALDASSDERRRIAGRLHDGAIQDLTASALALHGGASRAQRSGDAALAAELDEAARTLRANVGGLRSLLVDVYPPSLTAAGIRPALDDLADAVRGRGVRVRIVDDELPDLTPDEARLVFRVVRECLANTVRHAKAGEAVVTLGPVQPDGSVPVEIADDGHGFDPEGIEQPESGHLGIPLIVEAAAAEGARLRVRSRPGQGTRWQLVLRANASAGARG